MTIVFTDIAGSTRLAERLGDRGWVERLAGHDELGRREAAARGGWEVKSQGDGFMLAFPAARSAIDFAVALQRQLDTRAREEPARALGVRIGAHTGEAVRVGHDLLGHAVAMAARIAAACDGGQIAVSDLVRQLTERAGDLAFEDLGPVALKAIATPQRVHLVEWRDAGAPVAAGRPPSAGRDRVGRDPVG